MRRKGLPIVGKSMLTVGFSGHVAKKPALSTRTISVLAYISAADLFRIGTAQRAPLPTLQLLEPAIDHKSAYAFSSVSPVHSVNTAKGF
jgi:hypothetical protein